jgi:hypothetical protein
MKNITPDFIIEADNVYRTKHYIVKQVICLETPEDENNGIKSYDTFYKRNKIRDKQYEVVFYNRKHINGKRLPSTMFSRKYIN